MAEHTVPEDNGPNTAGAFDVDPVGLQSGLDYLDRTESQWLLDPTAVSVDQPPNQAQLLDTLEEMLGAQTDGDLLVENLKENIEALEATQRSGPPPLEGIPTSTDLPEIGEIDVDELMQSRMTTRLALTSDPDEDEIIDDPHQATPMLSGLLEATGAVELRNDFTDGNSSGIIVHKGMFRGKPVYLYERITSLDEPFFDEDPTGYMRTARAVSEYWAGRTLNELSDADREVLRGVVGPDTVIDAPALPTRTSMAETIRLYAAMRAPDDGESHPAVPEA